MEIPQWVKPSAWGFVAGAVAITVVGFSAFGWVSGGTASQMATEQSEKAVLAALVPICLEQARNDPRQSEHFAELEAMSSWKRHTKVTEIGWATMPGSVEPTTTVARACASKLAASFTN